MRAGVLRRLVNAVGRLRARHACCAVQEPSPKQATNDDIFALLDEMLEETGGPMTQDEIAWADRILDGRSKNL